MSEIAEQPTTILLLDDDHDVLGANSRFLRLNNLEVLVADHASRALAMLSEHRIDLVVTDLRMPECDGLSFVRQARQVCPLLPVLFFSGYARIPDIVAAMRLGAVDFLEKPVEPDLMLEKIQEIIGSQYSVDSLQRLAFNTNDIEAPFRHRVLAYEKFMIESCLQQHNGRIALVLNALQINRRTLNDKMSKLGINRQVSED